MYISHIKTQIEKAWKEEITLPQELLDLEGWSNKKVRILLNGICSMPNSNYLEIGVFRGSTFVSALYSNSFNYACAIDNWSEFNGSTEPFLNNVGKYLKVNDNNFNFINKDCFKTDYKDFKNRKFNIYFYDGDHKELSQYRALSYFVNMGILDDTFIYICDDWNNTEIKEGTEKAISDLYLNIIFKEELPGIHPNGPFWNGLGVFILQKNIR